jgi:hypothetical protein
MAISRMPISRTAILRGAACGVLTMVAMACGAAQHPPAERAAATVESVPEAPVGEAPKCVDENDQPVSCLSDADCCAGFVCGKDPELSRRTNYCVYGG